MKLYYPYEIEVILKGSEETYLNNPPMETLTLSRSCIDKNKPPMHRPVRRVDDEHVRLLMSEFEISRNEAEEALERSNDDLYMAAIDILS
jgi:NACalpha-BTF3-like transcription factor